MTPEQLVSLREHSSREHVFLKTLSDLTEDQRKILGFDKSFRKVSNNKVGEIDVTNQDVKSQVTEAYDLEIRIGGFISDWTMNQIESKIEMYKEENNKYPTNLFVRINSGGGSAFAGMSIHNYLSTYSGNVDTIIDGLAASAAASIFMAGQERLIHKNMTTFMIHRAMSWIDILEFGNQNYLSTVDVEREKQQVLQLLQVLDVDLIDLYDEKTELNKTQVIKYMDNEHFFNKTEMIKFGIATGVYEKPSSKKEDNDETEDQSQESNQVDPKQNRPKGETSNNSSADMDILARALFF